MKPDGTSSFSTADEKLVSPEGNHVTEQENKSGSEVKKCHQSDETTWSYLFVHHNKVKGMEAQLIKDGITYFVHKTIRYFKKTGKHKVQHKEIPTVSGLVFFQGHPKEIQAYLDNYFPYAHLCKNCSTGKVAQMRNLQEREALIDRYFHPVKTANEVAVQAENIDYLREYVLAELAQKRMDINKAWSTYIFIIKEIGYYYAPFIEQFKENLDPIMKMGAKILQEIDSILDSPTLDKDTRDRYQSEHEKLMLDYDYLF